MIRNIQALFIAVVGMGSSSVALADYTCSTTVDGRTFTATSYNEREARFSVQEICVARTHDMQNCRQATVCRLIDDDYSGGNRRYEQDLLSMREDREFIRAIQRRPLNGCTIGNGTRGVTYYLYYILRYNRSIDVGTNSLADAVWKMKRAIRQGACR